MTKGASKAKRASLPSRKPIAEAFIYAGALGLFAYIIYILIFALVVNMFNDTGSTAVGPFTLLFVMIGGSFVAQAILLIKQWQRVDRYLQRLISLGAILLLPFLVFVRMVGEAIIVSMWRQNQEGILPLDTPLYSVITALTSGTVLTVAALVSLAGSIWLWVLLLKKDKLLWILEGNPRTKEYKQRRAQLARNKKIGSYLIIAPVVLFGLFVYTALSAGFNGGNMVLYSAAGVMKLLLLYLSIPSLIAGIIVLARNK